MYPHMNKRSVLSAILLSFSLAACMTDVGDAGTGGNGGSSGIDDEGNGNGNGHGDGNGNGGGGGGGGAQPADVADMISSVDCEQAFQCKSSFPTDGGGTFAQVFGNSVDECYGINAEFWGVDSINAAVEAGTVQFDQAAADECLGSQPSAPQCSAFWQEGPGVPEACWAALAGTVPNGGACQISFECSEGYCDGSKCTAGE
jgi:hypothetical protein